MNQRYANFKSNVKARESKMVKDVDFDYLYSITRSRLKRTNSIYPYLTDEQKNIMVNNILIFSFTQKIINAYITNGLTKEQITDEVLAELIRGESFIMENMYESNPRF